MFPGPNATVYRNEAGEPIGWSDESSYEPDPYDGYDDDRYDYADAIAEEEYEAEMAAREAAEMEEDDES